MLAPARADREHKPPLFTDICLICFLDTRSGIYVVENLIWLSCWLWISPSFPHSKIILRGTRVLWTILSNLDIWQLWFCWMKLISCIPKESLHIMKRWNLVYRRSNKNIRSIRIRNKITAYFFLREQFLASLQGNFEIVGGVIPALIDIRAKLTQNFDGHGWSAPNARRLSPSQRCLL